MVRSPAPNTQLLCVRCNRDTTIPLPNGISASPTSPTDDNRPPAGYHPFVNGDDMENDEDEPDIGGMQVDPTVRAHETSQLDCTTPNWSSNVSGPTTAIWSSIQTDRWETITRILSSRWNMFYGHMLWSTTSPSELLTARCHYYGCPEKLNDGCVLYVAKYILK
jgi:hypothetical protein